VVVLAVVVGQVMQQEQVLLAKALRVELPQALKVVVVVEVLLLVPQALVQMIRQVCQELVVQAQPIQ
jgi:hypothetical protein